MTKTISVGSITVSTPQTSCRFCDGAIHTNADFTICIQCGLEQTPSEQWRLELR